MSRPRYTIDIIINMDTNEVHERHESVDAYYVPVVIDECVHANAHYASSFVFTLAKLPG